MGSLTAPGTLRIAYVLKRYPRLSETFILNEILALEAAGAAIAITSLMAKETELPDHPAVAEVAARVRYVSDLGRFSRAHLHLNVAQRHPRAYTTAAAAALRSSVALRDRRPWKDFRRAVIAADEVERHDADHIHAHFASGATRVARIAAGLTGRPFSFTAHAKDIYELDEAGLTLLRSHLAEAAAVVTISEFNRGYLAEIAPVSVDKIRVVANGLDPDWFSSPVRRPPAGAPVVLAIGRFVEKKGFAYLLDACAMLQTAGVSFRCRIVGAGPLGLALADQIARRGLGGLVDLAGPSDQAALRNRHFAEAACLVVPSVVATSGDRDGLPTVIAESMALGVPVVATDVTAIPEVVRDGETGLLVPQRDPEALASAIARLLAEPALADRLVLNAHALAVATFDRRATGRELLDLFGRSTAQSPVAIAGVGPARPLEAVS